MSDALKEATNWYVKLHAPDVCDDDHANFAIWQASAKENEQAWQRIVQINHQFEDIEPKLGSATLRRKQSISVGRRRALKQLGVMLAVSSTAGYVGYRQQTWQIMLADYKTDKGESREITLQDNTVIVLNTDTAINTHYNATGRVITLFNGEIHINTGHGVGSNTPFVVSTRFGNITALGTRFSVRKYPNHISVNVFEGAVELAPANNANRKRLNANQSAKFTNVDIGNITTLDAGANLWTKGIIYVVNMPLQEFLAELSRYHQVFLQCDDSVANILISGSFPIIDLNAILSSLTKTYPVRMQSFTRYWLTFKAV